MMMSGCSGNEQACERSCCSGITFLSICMICCFYSVFVPWNFRGKKTSIGDFGWVQRGRWCFGPSLFRVAAANTGHVAGRRTDDLDWREAHHLTSPSSQPNNNSTRDREILSIDNTTHLIATDSTLYKDIHVIAFIFGPWIHFPSALFSECGPVRWRW